jgi:hypothetical protein
MMTECEWIRAAILESFDEPGALTRRPDIARHVRGCGSCEAFTRRHHELDTKLATSLSPPALGTSFRASLRRQIRRDIMGGWQERLPDIMHLSGCGVAVMIYAKLVPADRPMTLVVGMLGTLLTYAVMSVARGWLEDVDCS